MESAPTPALTKAQRVNRINRRTVAWLLELIPLMVLAGLLTRYVFAWEPLPWVLLTAWLAVRDLAGPSYGKRLVGLGLESTNGDAVALSTGAKFLRNVPLMIPLFAVVEFCVAYFGSDPKMSRLGDRLAHTQVVDVSPERFGNGSWSGPLVLVVVAHAVVRWLLGML